MSASDPYPGRAFVATVDCHPIDSFFDRMNRLTELLKEAGFDVECPGNSSGMSGILVPSAQQSAARDFLRPLRLDWITAWVSEGGNSQAQIFGWYSEEKREPNQLPETTRGK